MKLKYILTKEGAFVLFHPITTHADMAKGLYGTPISAGFCYISPADPKPNYMRSTEIQVKCSGESISMKLESRPEDSEYITNKLNSYD